MFDAVTNAAAAEIPVGTAPRSVAVAPDGRIWVVNRDTANISIVSPSTLAIVQTVALPRASQPYGIVYTNGAIWYNESAIRPNTIVRFDPKSEKFQSWIIPAGGGVVRNMSVLPNGNISMAESGVNRVALVEINGKSNGTN